MDRKTRKRRQETRQGFSRRAFLKGFGSGALGAGLLGAAAPESGKGKPAAAGPRTFGPAAVPLTLKINGQPRSIRVEPRVTLLNALLDAEPRPSLQQVREALSGHLCRCGTYPRVFEAVMAAAARGKV